MISNKPKLQVVIKSREKELYNDYASSVTSLNATGVFDILGQHANFITLIKSYIVVDEGLPTRQEFKLDRGVIRVNSDVVTAYLGI
jgi:F0F1-type ATP synthase epsilon subunit